MTLGADRVEYWSVRWHEKFFKLLCVCRLYENYVITIQWNLDLTNSLGTGQIRSLNRGFVISSLFYMYFTISGPKNTVRYIEFFVKLRFQSNLKFQSKFESFNILDWIHESWTWLSVKKGYVTNWSRCDVAKKNPPYFYLIKVEMIFFFQLCMWLKV